MLKEGMFIQGRYEIVGKIGTGGMADVYKAKDHKLNRFVAVKVLKPEFREDKAFITKFRAEAQAAAGLSHLNIVNIYDVGEDHGVNFIVMELVEGITLKEYIGKKGRLAVREATSIAIQVSQGLEAAHNSGIIHRDVKPQNIIISTDGKVKVTDFGIARAVSGNTISSTVMGSVHYSSPEQARGGYSDAKSDIYSLGITLYEMLTGRVPFDGDTTVAIAIKHLQEEMKSPEFYVPDLPRSTVQIINKCTQKSPDRRYANMAELIRDLKESLVNPEGDFVQILNVNNGGRTVVISKEELGAIKAGAGMASAGEKAPYPGNGQPMNVPSMKNPQGAGAMGGAPVMNGPGMNRPPVNGSGMNRPPVNGSGMNRPPMNGMNRPMGNEPGMNGSGMRAPYDPYAYGMDSRAYGNRGYHYEDDNKRGFKEDEEDHGILNPKLEKIMTVGSIVIAILIACIFLGLIANALGIFRFSLPSIMNLKNSFSKQTEAPTENPWNNGGSTAVTEDTYLPPATETVMTEDTVETDVPETEPQTEATEEEILEAGMGPIPGVEGMTYDDAVNSMMTAGFYVVEQVDPSNEVPQGIVMKQSMTGEAKLGSTVILIVSGGPETAPDENGGTGDTAGTTWLCNAQLDVPEGYNGEAAKLELVQNGQTTTVTEGTALTFPYDVSGVQGTPGVADGIFNLYIYNEVTGAYDIYASYPVTFTQVP